MKVEKSDLQKPILIIGHKIPDLDAVASAYAYQEYKSDRNEYNYEATRCDEANNLTRWIFNKFNIDLPKYINDVSGNRIVLVDHTDPDQRPNGWQNAEIVEVIDHHKLKDNDTLPSKLTIKPYGSTCTIIGLKMIEGGGHLDKNLAGLMLAAILDDTLALRSPVTTEIDKFVAGELSSISGISDLGSFAKQIFNKKDSWIKKSEQNIINTDVKKYHFNDKLIKVSQVESMDTHQIEKRAEDIIKEMKKESQEGQIDLFLVMLTDLLTNDCILLFTGPDSDVIRDVFGKTPDDTNRIYLPGVVSRKKQIIPKLAEYYKQI